MTESTRAPSDIVFYTEHAFVEPEVGPTADTQTVRSQLTLTVAPSNATVDLSWERIQRMLSDRRVVPQRLLCVDDVNGYLVAVPPALEQCAGSVQTLFLDCFALRGLPDWFGAFSLLTNLVLEGGDGAYFVALPECMGGLASLTFLELDMFPIMQSLPTSLAQLTELQTLVIRECPMLSVALDLVPSVTVLTVVRCKMVVLPTTCTMGDKSSLLRELTVGVGQAGLQVAQVARGALEAISIEGYDNEVEMDMSSHFGEWASMRHITLRLHGLASLSGMHALTSVCTLRLHECNNIVDLAPIVALHASLTSLCLHALRAVRHLPVAIGSLSSLTQLVIHQCALWRLPASFGELTLLRSLDVGVVGKLFVDGHVFSDLASFLPGFGLLQRLHVNGDSERDAVFLGLSLQAWPPPYLTDSQLRLSHVSVALGFPGDYAYERTDQQMLQYFRVERSDKMALVTAFACGLHQRLGEASTVLQLNDTVVVLVADMVLGVDKLIVLHQQQRAYTGAGEYPGYGIPWLCVCLDRRRFTHTGPREWKCACETARAHHAAGLRCFLYGHETDDVWWRRYVCGGRPAHKGPPCGAREHWLDHLLQDVQEPGYVH